jgi:hypothetical protein
MSTFAVGAVGHREELCGQIFPEFLFLFLPFQGSNLEKERDEHGNLYS